MNVRGIVAFGMVSTIGFGANALQSPQRQTSYSSAIDKTAMMVDNPTAKRLAAKHGLDVLNVTWEDTGRFKGSSVGPNISDMTIQVAEPRGPGGKLRVTCMPVIRYPNFSDRTCDIDPDELTLLVGNEKGQPLRRVSLREFLKNPAAHLSRPESWKAKTKTLWAPRDEAVLCSAQACFLPIPREGKATFNPVLFNYQSTKGNPAVLTILVTRQGTSATIIDNARDAFETGAVWGQRLFHNVNGKRASLTGTRLSEFGTGPGESATVGKEPGKAVGGLNMVLLIQVPLKHKEMSRMGYGAGGGMGAAAPASARSESLKSSDVENAVIGHGDLEGVFTEMDNLAVERDPRFPVRATVQFYKATSNGVVSEADLADIKSQLDRVYAKSDYVGSLVTDGTTGRITEYDGAKVQPRDWWEQFWRTRERETGEPREQIMRRLRELLGRDFQVRPVTELYLRDLLRKRPRKA